MNKVILLGRLTKEADIRVSEKNNTKIANFTLAVNRNYVKEGEVRQADFINVVAYSKLADFTEKYLRKGIQICLCGRIQTRSWDDDNGLRHYATNVIAEEINFADSPKKADDSLLNSPSVNEVTNSDDTFCSSDDDLPF